MKNIYKLTIAVLVVIAFGAGAYAFAQTQDPAVTSGQQLWGQLQVKQIQCSQLTNANLINLGEYFMDQMMDGAHEAMDQAVLARSGQTGLDAMHLAMGERFSGCNPNAAFPNGMMGYGMPMMGGYGYHNGASSTPNQINYPYYNGMMGYGNGFGPMMGYGAWSPWVWIFMILFWALVVVGIVVLIQWLIHRRRGWHDRGRSAMDILKERYVKGEINRKEFEEKKKDLE